jgi:biopolymer transport protein ExbB
LKDDKRPLYYQVESVDTLREIDLIWVRRDDFWMYYGNGNAPNDSDSKSFYDTAQSLVYHFKDGGALPQDASA